MACFIPTSAVFNGDRTKVFRTGPYNLFGWNFGKSKSDDDTPKTKYHDIDLPFSLSLVDKTFLRGTLSLSLSDFMMSLCCN